MIPNGEGWHYLAVKKVSALLREITSKNNGNFHCLKCLHSFRTKSKLELQKKECENKDFCNIVMPAEDTKISGLNQYQKSDEAPFIIYENLECLKGKIDKCKHSPENSSTTKVGEHIPSSFSLPRISLLKTKDCMKKFCALRKHEEN